jgi:hypothetical protein
VIEWDVMEMDWVRTFAEEEEEAEGDPFPRACTLGALRDFKESCLSTGGMEGGVCVCVCVCVQG